MAKDTQDVELLKAEIQELKEDLATLESGIRILVDSLRRMGVLQQEVANPFAEGVSFTG